MYETVNNIFKRTKNLYEKINNSYKRKTVKYVLYVVTKLMQ